MWSIKDDITRAISELKLPTSEIRLCEKNEALNIFTKAKNIFVKDNPRVWWLSLNVPFESFYYEASDGFKYLGKYISKKETSFWFIPETDEGNILVFETTLNALEEVIGETNFFEYNLVGKNFDWIVIENDHNEIIVGHV